MIGYESLIESMTNEPKDRHVLAAAVRANAEVVVTFNVKDFPEAALKLGRLERSGLQGFAAEVRRHLP